MKKHLIILPVLVALIAVGGVGYVMVGKGETPSTEVKESPKPKTFQDNKGGVSLSLTDSYGKVAISPSPEGNSKSSAILQLQRSDPQAFMIVRHDTGLASPAAMLRQNLTEYVENTIRQFYSVRYGSSYKSEGIKRTKVGDRDAIEHVYSYTDKDGKPNKVRLLAIIWSPDETYNIILQSHTDNFERVKGDLDTVKTTFKAPE